MGVFSKGMERFKFAIIYIYVLNYNSTNRSYAKVHRLDALLKKPISVENNHNNQKQKQCRQATQPEKTLQKRKIILEVGCGMKILDLHIIVTLLK